MDEITRLNEELTQLQSRLPATMSEAVLLLIEITWINDRIRWLSLNKKQAETSH